MLGLSWPQMLGLTGFAAIVSAVTSLFALFLKEFIAVRSFERWKAEQTLVQAYRRYQLPIYLAADELSSRFYSLSRKDFFPGERAVGREMLGAEAQQERNVSAGTHYLQYRFASNVYRLCGFLGWIELYRRDIGTLDPSILDRNGRLEACLREIRGVLADGWLNRHNDRLQWRDILLFREEQRAIAHRMIAPGDRPSIIDFGTFYERLLADRSGSGDARWFMLAASLFEHFQPERDFRIVRMKMLVAHLTELMELLQPGRTPKQYLETAAAYRNDIGRLTGAK
jgi:hypothetical protein